MRLTKCLVMPDSFKPGLSKCSFRFGTEMTSMALCKERKKERKKLDFGPGPTGPYFINSSHDYPVNRYITIVYMTMIQKNLIGFAGIITAPANWTERRLIFEADDRKMSCYYTSEGTIKCIFFSEFHPKAGPKITYQVFNE